MPGYVDRSRQGIEAYDDGRYGILVSAGRRGRSVRAGVRKQHRAKYECHRDGRDKFICFSEHILNLYAHDILYALDILKVVYH